MHYHLYAQIHRRSDDGIHWNPDGVRFQVNVILTHLCLSRDNLKLPGHWTDPVDHHVPCADWNTPLESVKEMAKAAKSDRKKKEEREDRRRRGRAAAAAGEVQVMQQPQERRVAVPKRTVTLGVRRRQIDFENLRTS
jgi:hypothetical protein